MYDWLSYRAKINPDREAVVCRGEVWTYATLNERVADLSARLSGAGIQPGRRVAVLMPNRLEHVALIHALVRLEAVFVPLNTRLTAQELDWQVSQAECSAVICSQETEEQAHALGQKGRWVLTVDSPQTPPTESIQGYEGDPAGWYIQPLDLDSNQAVIYTSGTTGEPKGAVLTIGNHLWSATASAYRLGTLPDDRWLLCMPLYHVGGMAIVFRCCLYGTTIVLQEKFNVDAVAHALSNNHITLVSLVPTMLQRLLATHPEALLQPKLRCILLGGAGVSQALIQKCVQMNLPVAVTYGLTEAASQVATALPEQVRQKPTTSGKALMFTQIRIINDRGRECEPGEIGEILVKGPTVMHGYYQNPEATLSTLRENWLHTGDVGFLDEADELHVLERRTDLIVTGGENVYPTEVEEVLCTHPSVAEAGVVGMPDEEWGQRVTAAVVMKNNAAISETELLAFCRERIAGYKIPQKVYFVKSLPRTASGKIKRHVLKEQMKNKEKS